ncbi:phosphoenolpyruvate synthase [Salibacterium aidingense]|uniref:phosphoenolpyruvate synthase n=1 Tax=Salibacterium aidingense TaxID=384933 RepID=UPI003BCB9B8A
MHSFVKDLKELASTDVSAVGGKGFNLGKLAEIEDIRVPDGFCVTTAAYRAMLNDSAEIQKKIEELSWLSLSEKEAIKSVSKSIRELIEEGRIPAEVNQRILGQLSRFSNGQAFAVRSSATAEDLPTASFAGQQDSFLNIVEETSILSHIKKCWASLFTERAVMYRLQNGFEHQNVYLSVIVQQMIVPEASGIMFTADPVSSNRHIISIDAGFGLGEPIVSGTAAADNYKVKENSIIEKNIASKKTAVYSLEGGGTEQRTLKVGLQDQQVLRDSHILKLEQLGRKIEERFSSPQDIEWCLVEETIYVVQSRPITTLYPLPDHADDNNRVYMSMGHQQMMTEPIKPLGISFFQFLSRGFPLFEAGGRLFVELTHDLASPLGRKILMSTMGRNDPLMKNALARLIKRKDFIKALPHGKKIFSFKTDGLSPNLLYQTWKQYRENDVSVVPQLIASYERSLQKLKHDIQHKSGEEVFTFILEDHKQLKADLYKAKSMGTLTAGLFAGRWLNEKMKKWLGEKNAADTLAQSVPYNITSEMGLDLLEVADTARRYPEVITYLSQPSEEEFFKKLTAVHGGEAVAETIQSYLDKYGMRCSGEIDITTTRWSENPAALAPMILSNIKNFEPNAKEYKWQKGLEEAKAKEKELLSRVRALRGGKRKAKKTEKAIRVLRNFSGYREYPKYAFVSRYFHYKKALLKEAAVLVEKGVIQRKEDVYFLSFEEFRNTVQIGEVDYQTIVHRQEKYHTYEKLRPPRLMTSEGEILFGEYKKTASLPPGAIPGLPVSSGVTEGRARVIMNMEDADIEEGDILVTPFTDPSWTPLFVSIGGLVTEVGGVMTHGSVIAREYGLPAVVSVENATSHIKDGQQIRVHGTEGYVEIL